MNKSTNNIDFGGEPIKLKDTNNVKIFKKLMKGEASLKKIFSKN